MTIDGNGENSGRTRERKLALVKKAGKLAATLSEIIEELDEIERTSVHTPRPRTIHDYTARAEHVEVRERAEHEFEVEIDGRVILLSHSLAALVTVLAQDGGEALDDDDLVAWKSLDEVRHVLKKHSGHPVSRGALNQRIYVFRALLRLAELPSGLVQTSREFGVRFAVKRSVRTGIGSE